MHKPLPQHIAAAPQIDPQEALSFGASISLPVVLFDQGLE